VISQPDPFLALDPTSIIKTLGNRLRLASLTNRDAQAADLAGVLTVWPPRTDLPFIAFPPRLIAALAVRHLEELSPFQRQFVVSAAAHIGAPRTVAEAAAFLKESAKIRRGHPARTLRRLQGCSRLLTSREQGARSVRRCENVHRVASAGDRDVKEPPTLVKWCRIVL
jgi:hypothetical protein